MPAELSSALVSTEWLAQHLDDDNLRIFDCHVNFGYDDDKGFVVTSGQPQYEQEHIPGAAHVDLVDDLSDRTTDIALMMPSADIVSQVLSAAGLGNDHQVVIYSSGSIMWATRFWWMLRASGFTNAGILEGGLQKWKDEGRPIASGEEHYPPATFTPHSDPDRWADKEAVLAEIENGSICTIHTLSHKRFSGTTDLEPYEQVAYGRKGRIKGSINLPYANLVDEDGLFLSVDELKQRFQEVDALNKERIICYCGAGISSTINAFALHLIGYDNVAIYDGSLNEWGRDHSLPMETD